MGLLGKLFNRKTETPEKLMVIMVVKSTELILEEGNKRINSLLEATLFSSVYALKRIEVELPNHFPEFKRRYIDELVAYMIYLGYGKGKPGTLYQKNIIDRRFEFYENEFDRMDNPMYRPTKLAYKFAKDSDSTIHGDIYDEKTLMRLTVMLGELFSLLEESVKLVVPEVKSQY